MLAVAFHAGSSISDIVIVVGFREVQMFKDEWPTHGTKQSNKMTGKIM